MKKKTKKILTWSAIIIGVVIVAFIISKLLAFSSSLIYIDNVQGNAWLDRANPFTFKIYVEQGAGGAFVKNATISVPGGAYWTQTLWTCGPCYYYTRTQDASCPSGYSIWSIGGAWPGGGESCGTRIKCPYKYRSATCKKNDNVYYDWKKVECQYSNKSWVTVFDFKKDQTYTGLSDNVADILNEVCYSQIVSRMDEYHNNDCVVNCRASASHSVGQMDVSMTNLVGYNDPCDYEPYEQENYIDCNPDTCKSLYWIDENHTICSESQKKVICDKDRYESLKTFETLDACKEATKKTFWIIRDNKCIKIETPLCPEGDTCYGNEESCEANLLTCEDIPYKPCDEAIWKEYPDCKWDVSECEDPQCEGIPTMPCVGAIWMKYPTCLWNTTGCDQLTNCWVVKNGDCVGLISNCPSNSYSSELNCLESINASWCASEAECEENQYCTTEDGDCYSKGDLNVCYGYCRKKGFADNLAYVAIGIFVVVLILLATYWLFKKKK